MNGIADSASAADAPVIASTSESFSESAEITSAMICVSWRQPAGNSGRIGRSIRRLVSTSFSLRLALALEEAAGNASRGVGVFLVVDGERQEVDALARVGGRAGGDEDHGVARADDDRAVGLLGEPAGLDGDGLTADGDFACVHVLSFV